MKKRIITLLLAAFVLAGTVLAVQGDKPKHRVELVCPDKALYKGECFQFSAVCETGTPVFSVDRPELMEISAEGLARALQWGSAEVIVSVPETEAYAAVEFRIPVEIAAEHDPNPDIPAPPYEVTEPTLPEAPENPPLPGMPTKFVDVTHEDYFAGAVDWAVDCGVTKGVDETHFAPEQICTRGQVVTFLWRAMGCPEPETHQSPFRDVADSDCYYYKAVLWAVEQGITTGTGEGFFSLEESCSRGQVVTFLWRAAGAKKSVWGIQFADVTRDQYYGEAVSWAVENGIAQGMGLNRFQPDTVCSRGQIVTFLFRSVR